VPAAESTSASASADSDNAAAAIKDTQRSIWASGNYAAVANLTDSTQPEHLLRLVSIEPGQRVLDVATGSGNVALRAARAGAEVTGLDLTPALLDKAQQRADDWGVQVDWQVGDAEALPYDSGTFDRVLSALGVIFAPRHAVAAGELVRVCKPGGVIGLVNWTPAGQVGQLLQIMSRYLPAPPSFASPPVAWGEESHVRELFAPYGISPDFHRGVSPIRFPSAEDYVSFMETSYGPTISARARLLAEGRWETCRAEIIDLARKASRSCYRRRPSRPTRRSRSSSTQAPMMEPMMPTAWKLCTLTE
jgi:SAM-dependent methyltransferase